MKLLLDTHALLWWWSEPAKLSPRVLGLLRDPSTDVVVSAASAWEISTKHRLGKLPSGGSMIEGWSGRLAEDRFRELPIGSGHAFRADSLPGEHRDPFDRMLAAQSIVEGLPIASADAALSAFGAERVWE
jgi:PIN domain nuclease of toxin-antitoxin system